MSIKLRIIDKKSEKVVEAEKGTMLMNAIRDARFYVEAPCGGNGKCKKCTVNVEGIGDILSCTTKITEDLLQDGRDEIIVRVPERGGAVIKSLGLMPDYFFNPIIKVMTVDLSRPSVSDQMPDDRRIARAAGAHLALHLLPELPGILRSSDFTVDCLIRQDIGEIISVRPAGSTMQVYGVSVDIGTTTLSASLFDLRDGRHVKTANSLNPQKAYGADVISRIDYASQSPLHLQSLQDLIFDEIYRLLHELADNTESIQVVSIAGNTTMMHLLCGHDPSAIARAPFIPVTLSGRIRYFHELFPAYALRYGMDPVCILLPSIAGYVGADITAGILATDLDKSKRSSLLIDIGTNGEIALSSDENIVSCSTAAGPAFEGANISCGTGGIAGAIDRVVYENAKLDFTTIGDLPPAGICGSGIIATVAALLKSGVIDETGRFSDEPENLPANISQGFAELDGKTVYAFTLDQDGNPLIYMTQKDIREIQNAKAAVCAGIRLMISRSGLAAQSLDDVFVAGGFGNYMDIADAFTIGLLPPELKGKVIPVGNSSATGAALCMLDYKLFERCRKITKKTRYYELSSDKEFTDLYIEAMMFE
ncbi:MAG: ASKHA domain-containing protein [Saccharofermentanales bacterium]